MVLMKGVRNKMKQSDTQHQACNGAERDLQPGVVEPQREDQPAARQRGQQHEHAVDDQQQRWGKEKRIHVSGLFRRPERMADRV